MNTAFDYWFDYIQRNGEFQLGIKSIFATTNKIYCAYYSVGALSNHKVIFVGYRYSIPIPRSDIPSPGIYFIEDENANFVSLDNVRKFDIQDPSLDELISLRRII